jgi:iron complex transport system substrate-binding protein
MKRIFGSILILALVISLTGCGWFSSPPVDADPTPISLTDDFNRTVTLAEPAGKIISLAPSSTEILFALGLGDKVVGVTEFCNYPVEAQSITKVGGFGDPNLELIISLEPDLVLAASLHQTTVEALEELGIAVLALNPADIEGIYDNIALLGKAAAKEAAAQSLINDMKARIQAVTEKTSAISESERSVVYYEVWYPGPMTVGGDTFIHAIISLAGGKNIAADLTGWPTLQEEELLARNPQIILHGHFEADNSVFAARDGWNVVSAVAQGNIFHVDQDIMNRTGPRVVDAIEILAKLFYPELFE